MSTKPKEKKSEIPNFAKFAIGAISGSLATMFTQPIDMIKNRMQLSGEGGSAKIHKTSAHAAISVIKKEGPLALYDGISANIARQVLYTGTRIGLFQVMMDTMTKQHHTGIGPQLASGVSSGLIAATVSCPTDVALVRMTSDGRLPKAERRNYKHVGDAVVRIVKEEGIGALWTGSVPTIVRAMTGNAAQLVTYKQAKEYFLRNDLVKDGIKCHFASSLLSGFVYAFSTTPMDVAKTRIQMMKTINGKPEYSGMLDVWGKTVKKEGFTALWKGFGPYYFRIAPNTVLLFIFTERVNRMYKKYILEDEDAEGGF